MRGPSQEEEEEEEEEETGGGGDQFRDTSDLVEVVEVTVRSLIRSGPGKGGNMFKKYI